MQSGSMGACTASVDFSEAKMNAALRFLQFPDIWNVNLAAPDTSRRAYYTRAITATGPPPGGPWCSAPPDT